MYEGGCSDTVTSACVAAIDGTKQGGDVVTWQYAVGVTYHIAVFALPNSGDFELNITYLYDYEFQNATNDSCDKATPIRTGFTFESQPGSGFSMPYLNCNDGQTSYDYLRWHTFVAPPYCATAVAFSGPWQVFVYQDGCASATCVTAVKGTAQGSSVVTWKPVAGTTYLIAIRIEFEQESITEVACV